MKYLILIVYAAMLNLICRKPYWSSANVRQVSYRLAMKPKLCYMRGHKITPSDTFLSCRCVRGIFKFALIMRLSCRSEFQASVYTVPLG